MPTAPPHIVRTIFLCALPCWRWYRYRWQWLPLFRFMNLSITCLKADRVFQNPSDFFWCFCGSLITSFIQLYPTSLKPWGKNGVIINGWAANVCWNQIYLLALKDDPSIQSWWVWLEKWFNLLLRVYVLQSNMFPYGQWRSHSYPIRKRIKISSNADSPSGILFVPPDNGTVPNRIAIDRYSMIWNLKKSLF